jgi:hypothetical protein
MTRHIVGLAAAFILAQGAVPAYACINDREVARAEREFKSQYQQPVPTLDSYSEPSSPGRVTSVIFFGSGTALLLGATFSVLAPRRRTQP